MRIVYIIRSLAQRAGVERVMSDKINYLAENGYDITVITYDQGHHSCAFRLHKSVFHVDLGICFFRISRLGLLKRIPVLIKLRRQFKRKLHNILYEVNPDVIIVSTCSIKLMDIIVSIKTCACKVVESHVPCFAITKSFYYKDRWFLRFFSMLYDRWILGNVSKADLLVALTNGDALEWSKHISNVKVIPNPLSVFPKKVDCHIDSKKRILCVGRLNKEKQFDLIIEAFSYISDKYPQWKVDIFGEGTEKNNLNELIETMLLTKRVTIYPPTSNIFEEYQKSDFFVLSSEYEGFGLVLIEAMSCGIPCVSFRCKYGPEVIICDKRNGLLVTNGDVKELAEKMSWMISHPEERLFMGKNAREDVRRYRKSIIMRQWMDLFDEIK